LGGASVARPESPFRPFHLMFLAPLAVQEFRIEVKVPSGIAEDLGPKFLNRQVAKKTGRMALSSQKR
jgi:hypothetical protein